MLCFASAFSSSLLCLLRRTDRKCNHLNANSLSRNQIVECCRVGAAAAWTTYTKPTRSPSPSPTPSPTTASPTLSPTTPTPTTPTPTTSWSTQSGYPLPDGSNKLCATNGQQGSVTGSSALCAGAAANGMIPIGTCDHACIEARCVSDPLCVGYAWDGGANEWRPVSEISG